MSSVNDGPAENTGFANPVPADHRRAAGSAVIMDRDLVSSVVLPEQVGDAVAVHVGHRFEGPACGGGGVIQPGPGLVHRAACATVIVDGDLSGGVVLPDE